MFVSGSKYNKLKAKYDTLEDKRWELAIRYRDLSAKWETLVALINEKGGREFLDKASIGANVGLSSTEIRELIFLCHPDKHAGSTRAEEMTKRLLAMRK